MLGLIREHRFLYLGGTLAGLALRLIFVLCYPAVTDDSKIYANLAENWLHRGVYGQQGDPQGPILPTDSRLPGYPAFLATTFWIFGSANFRAVMLAQTLIGMVSCLIVADIARRMASGPVANAAFLIAATCPFLANYDAAVLTETLEVFFTTLALDLAISALNREGEARLKLWAATGAAIGGCILLRPDGGILLAAVLIYLGATYLGAEYLAGRKGTPDSAEQGRQFRRALLAGAIVATCALAPLVPWTIRNMHTLHHFQPLAPRYANDTDELVPRGFNRWTKTWIIDYVSVDEIFWNVPGDKIDAEKLPARAFDNAAERAATMEIIDAYNEILDVTPEVDARFGELAAKRIRANPMRYYALLPALRIVDMWLRPRTELLPPEPRWWEFRDDAMQTLCAAGFGLLNVAYVGAALWALVRRTSGIRWAGLLVVFLLLRSAFLGSLENPEPRYTLEGLPAIIVLGACIVAKPRPKLAEGA